MAWCDLEIGILEEFREAAQLAYRRRPSASAAVWVVAYRARAREWERTHDEKRRFRRLLVRRKRQKATWFCRRCGQRLPWLNKGEMKWCAECAAAIQRERVAQRRAAGLTTESERRRQERRLAARIASRGFDFRETPPTQPCAACGRVFQISRKNSRFCTRACGVRKGSRDAKMRKRMLRSVTSGPLQGQQK